MFVGGSSSPVILQHITHSKHSCRAPAGTTATFVRLDLADGSALTLSPDHFVPAVPAGRAAAWRNHVMMRAGEVQRGMHLFVAPVAAGSGGDSAAAASAAAAVGSAVLGVEVVEERGLYNPYTLGGMIVVDSVVASSHSAWVLDGLMDAADLTHWTPATYQALFAPIRALYHVLCWAPPARALRQLRLSPPS